jgi:hypothetical protein
LQERKKEKEANLNTEISTMIEILQPNDTFSFDVWTLRYPMHVAGGNMFSKLARGSDRQALYIQTPACFTKSGITVSSKRCQCDLLFSSQEDEEFLRWIENLVEHLQREIISHSAGSSSSSSSSSAVASKRELWFQNEFTENDIDEVFPTPLKPHRGGRKFALRCNIQLTNSAPLPSSSSSSLASSSSLSSMTPSIKIYDESQTHIPHTNIAENTRCISILEIQGVKCTAKNFQIEVLMKQMMVLDSQNIFDTECILAKPASGSTPAPAPATEHSANEDDKGSENILPPPVPAPPAAELEEVSFLDEDDPDSLKNQGILLDDEVVTLEPPKHNYDDDDEYEDDNDDDDDDDDEDEESRRRKEEAKQNTLRNTDLSLDSMQDQGGDKDGDNGISSMEIAAEEPIVVEETTATATEAATEAATTATEAATEADPAGEAEVVPPVMSQPSSLATGSVFEIKSAEEVYKDIYQEARDLALRAKENALKAYMEANHIKLKYQLENVPELETDEIDAIVL